jgi:flagellar biosynthesis GTPase FlhF
MNGRFGEFIGCWANKNKKHMKKHCEDKKEREQKNSEIENDQEQKTHEHEKKLRGQKRARTKKIENDQVQKEQEQKKEREQKTRTKKNSLYKPWVNFHHQMQNVECDPDFLFNHLGKIGAESFFIPQDQEMVGESGAESFLSPRDPNEEMVGEIGTESFFIPQDSHQEMVGKIDAESFFIPQDPHQEIVESFLTQQQQEIVDKIEVIHRHLKNPNMLLMLPMADYLGLETRQLMIRAWVADMEMEMWQILYLSTSDVFAANEALTSFVWRICAVTKDTSLLDIGV